jgi:hypothetical protein
MLKNITLSADEIHIQEARRLAALENTTLNQLFRDWLDAYITQRHAGTRQMMAARYDEWMRQLEHVNAGRKFTREEMNERR